MKPSEEDGERKCEGVGERGSWQENLRKKRNQSLLVASSCVRFVLCLAVLH